METTSHMVKMDLANWFEQVLGTEIKVLAIGGSDPSGGAGIQQDIRTITVLGAYGAAIPTALTIQNTLGVEEVIPIREREIEQQILKCLEDIHFDAVKTGMLATQNTIRALERVFSRYPPSILVIDPVLSSKNNTPLLEKSAQTDLIPRLSRFATVLTPNIPEAKILLDLDPKDPVSQEDLAKMLFERASEFSNGTMAVIVKGGHSEKEAMVTDVACFKEGVFATSGPRIETMHSHGTGCAYASSLATFLSGGLSIEDSMRLCREFMSSSLLSAHPIGKGIGPVDTLSIYRQHLYRDQVIEELERACDLLEQSKGAGRLCPEIQINLGYALPYARSVGQVAAFPGRIVRVGTGLTRVRNPEFGASRHVANIILTAMRFDPEMRSAMAIRMDHAFLKAAERLGLFVASFSRDEEPGTVKEKEGSSLVWGVKKAILDSGGKVPDLIWDHGDVGKEPAIRVLGKTPMDVVKKALSLLGQAH